VSDRPDTADKELLCPSARGAPGALLLGVVGADGRVGYVSSQVRVDEGFLAVAQAGRAPEKRFRFADRCVESGCVFWTDRSCHVAIAAVELVDAEADPGRLPRCTIRSRCRWYAQEGPKACAACPLVVTDVSESTTGGAFETQR
jgi:hypothetical protein